MAATSRTVSGVSPCSTGICGTYPIRRLSLTSDARPRGHTLCPNVPTCPPVGRANPNTHSKSVLLPAPFGPKMTTASPRSMPSRSMARISRPPRRTVNRRMSTARSGMGLEVRGQS